MIKAFTLFQTSSQKPASDCFACTTRMLYGDHFESQCSAVILSNSEGTRSTIFSSSLKVFSEISYMSHISAAASLRFITLIYLTSLRPICEWNDIYRTFVGTAVLNVGLALLQMTLRAILSFYFLKNE